MSIARKFITLAISVGVVASSPSGAEVLKADRVVLDVPDGGMTQSRPPRSVSIFKHRLFDVTVKADVEGANYYEYWQRGCTPGKGDPDAAAFYQVGTLARPDQYLYSKMVKSDKYGTFTAKGSWLEYCLLFRSGVLAARITIDLPKSALEKGEITAAEIEKALAGARLTDASVEDRGTNDPRIMLEMADEFVLSSLPDFSFDFKHNRLPFSIGVTLSGPKTYETARLLDGAASARAWKVGRLARADEYLYSFVWPDSTPAFALALRGTGFTAQINVSVGKLSLDRGDITVEEIERILASARTVPISGPDKK
jgi:hypothetical protein